MKLMRARVAGQRGIALVHALVLAIFVIAVALGLTMMVLQRFTAQARRQESNTKTAIDAGTLARLNSGWSVNATYSTVPMGGFCSTFSDARGTCTCSRSACNCTCNCTVSADSSQDTTATGSCAVTSPNCDQCSMQIQSQ